MSLMRRRPVTAQRIAYWKAAEFLGSGAAVFKKGDACQVGWWTRDDNGRRKFECLGEAFTWDEALTQAKAAVAKWRERTP